MKTNVGIKFKSIEENREIEKKLEELGMLMIRNGITLIIKNVITL